MITKVIEFHQNLGKLIYNDGVIWHGIAWLFPVEWTEFIRVIGTQRTIRPYEEWLKSGN